MSEMRPIFVSCGGNWGVVEDSIWDPGALKDITGLESVTADPSSEIL